MFDPALDVPGWPGPLGEREAVDGEAWLGPNGLLARLELELGLGARRQTAIERAAVLAGALRDRDGFWRASFEADPLATARRLLADRDLLMLWGWRGEPAGARLDALWQVTAGVAPGIADRLHVVLARLPGRRIDLERIAVVEERAALPPLWRRVLAQLEAAGVAVEHRPLEEARAAGDLAAARAPAFTPRGDGSLVLVRPQGPLAAAEEIAAALAACESLDGIVVIGADAVLDGALARHGVPRLGASRGAAGSSALVRQVIETAFAPMDPTVLHALVCAELSPVPRAIGWRLARALGEFPARGSHVWREALAAGLETIEDVGQRDDVAARITALVEPVVARDEALRLEALASRLRVLTSWARGRAEGAPSLWATISFAERVITLARLTGEPALSRTAIRRLCDELAPAELAGSTAEVGLANVASPGAMLAPARAVIWWSFSRAHAPVSERLRLSGTERAALVAAGVQPPDLGAVMEGEARRWRRPLALAEQALVLVCTRTDEAGEPAHPHPLWDELVAAMPAPASAHAARLTRGRVMLPAAARRVAVSLRPQLAPAAHVQLPGPLVLDRTESPSSLEQLLACSLAWALQRRGKLYAGVGTGPGDPGPLIYGNIAHHVLEHVFSAPVATAADAAMRVEQVLDAGLPQLAEALLLPELQTHRAELRRAIVETARELGDLLVRTGATVRGMELELRGEIGGVEVSGRADLVLDAPAAVIDFKWGTNTYRELLATGTALQLVLYAALARTGAALPEIAYLTLQRQQLLATPGTQLPDAWSPGRLDAQTMLDAASARLAQRQDQLAAGQLEAPAALDDVDDAGVIAGVMHVAPKCQYCAFGTLCGRSAR